MTQSMAEKESLKYMIIWVILILKEMIRYTVDLAMIYSLVFLGKTSFLAEAATTQFKLVMTI